MSNDNFTPQHGRDERLDDLDESRGQGDTRDAATSGSLEAFESLELDEGAFGRGEGVGESIETEGLSQGRIVLQRFVRHRGAVFGMIMFGLTAILSFSAMGVGPIPGWWPHDVSTPYNIAIPGGEPTMHMPTWLGGSGWTGVGPFPFGQDLIGQDNFAQVMKGIQTSIMVMFVIVIVAMLFGVIIGSLSGYYRGRLDNLLMRFTDLVITLPLIVIGAVLGKMVGTIPFKFNWSQGTVAAIQQWMPVELAFVLGLVLWPGLARLTRSEFLRLREYEFVDSARVAGASDRRIMFKHILPNAMGVVIVNVTLLMSASVVLEAALSYLGFGIRPPNVSLGLLISQNQAAFNTRPWLFWWPGLFIIILALSVNFIGDGLRDAFDPRTKRIPSQRTMDKAAARANADTRAQAPSNSSGGAQ